MQAKFSHPSIHPSIPPSVRPSSIHPSASQPAGRPASQPAIHPFKASVSSTSSRRRRGHASQAKDAPQKRAELHPLYGRRQGNGTAQDMRKANVPTGTLHGIRRTQVTKRGETEKSSFGPHSEPFVIRTRDPAPDRSENNRISGEKAWQHEQGYQASCRGLSSTHGLRDLGLRFVFHPV